MRRQAQRIVIAALIGAPITAAFYWAGRDERRDWVGSLVAPGWLLFYLFFPTGVHSGANPVPWVFGLNALADSLIAYGTLTVLRKRVRP